jgi:uncharacterized protein YbjT (DUF2867 family)
MKINAIVLGATGMVGEGVLHVALNHDDVASVLVLGRRPCGVEHPKLKEIIHPNLHDLSSIAGQLQGYQACYFCLGTSSIGMKEDEYRRVTYDLTLHVAGTLSAVNPNMTFCYISGEGTDSSEKGRSMWARVKGKTENDLTKLPFRSVFNFRPGFIKPINGMKNTLSFAKPLLVLYPFFKMILPDHGCTLEDIGNAMINVTQRSYPKQILENPDIATAASNNY